jgi:hypothetical protein
LEICYRRVELEHCDEWWRTIAGVEKERRAKAPASYAKQIRTSHRQQSVNHIRLFQQYMAEDSCPFPVIRKGDMGELELDVAALWNSKSRGSGEVFLGRIGKGIQTAESPAQEVVSGKDGELPPVSDIQPQAKDVRDDGAGESTGGLPVLHAGEVLPERELLGVGAGA